MKAHSESGRSQTRLRGGAFSKRFRVCQRGFTLPELLMVIFIVAIACALLFPVSQSFITKSQSVVCMGNLRKIAVAVSLYSGENDNFIPPITTGFPDESGNQVNTCWWNDISPYLPCKNFDGAVSAYSPDIKNQSRPSGDAKAYVCPGNSRLGNRGGAFVNYTGMLNASGNTYLSTKRETRRQTTSFRVPLNQLPYLVDGFASDNYSSISQYLVDLYSTTTASQGKINVTAPKQGIFAPVHGNNINILYLDGHAAPVDIRDFATATFDYSKP